MSRRRAAFAKAMGPDLRGRAVTGDDHVEAVAAQATASPLFRSQQPSEATPRGSEPTVRGTHTLT